MVKIWSIGMLAVAFSFIALSGVSAEDEAKKKGKGRFGKGDPEAVFKKMDANGDGKVTKDEYQTATAKFLEKIQDAGKAAKIRDGMGKRFDAAVGSGDGLSLDQFRKMRAEGFRKKKKDAN